MSRAELEEISEGLITAYANKFSNRVIQSIDIEHFITEFLMLRIEYASFAEDDAGRIGFLADGATPLLVHQDGKIIPFVFPKDTIVLDKFLLAEKEQGRRRFTMAHEASHHILSKMYSLDEECIECSRYSDYCEHILPALWIDDDFLNNEKLEFDYEKFELIDTGVKYLNPKHFSVKSFVKYCRFSKE